MAESKPFGTFELEFETWLSQNNACNSNMASDTEDSKPTVKTEHIDTTMTSLHITCQSSAHLLEKSSCGTRKLHKCKRYQASKAVVKKYRNQRWLNSKKHGRSPGCQTDDSGVVSPGNDAVSETGKLIEGIDCCFSGNDSPPNIEDDWIDDRSTYSVQSCQEQPPKLFPSLHPASNTTCSQEKVGQCQFVIDHECAKFDKSKIKSGSLNHYNSKRSLEFDTYEFADEHDAKSECHLSYAPGRIKKLKTNSSNDVPLKITVRANHKSKPDRDATASLCLESPLSGDCDQTGYVTRNGCEIGGSDSGAGSQSESCCEESPRPENDNHSTTSQIGNESSQFPCDNQRFTVIPSDNTKKLSASGSPPLLLKLKKCEQEKSHKKAGPSYFTVKVIDRSNVNNSTNVLKIDKSVLQSYYKNSKKQDVDCGKTNDTKMERRTEEQETCSSSSKKGSKVHQVPMQNDCSKLVTESSHERKFIRQCLYLSVLQTKVHTLFQTLFPSLNLVLSHVSPEGRHFSILIDSVIALLQRSEADDEVQDNEVINGGLENLTLNADISARKGHVHVCEPSIILCRSPDQCLIDFREKIFVLVQLLLPELTMNRESNLFRSQRELSKFLDKLISYNTACQ